ncbi:MAG TPA: Arc family DNA-binding protein [Rhizomicrobium sp.]
MPDDIAEKLRTRAERNHRSLQGEMMALLEQSVCDRSLADEAREFRAQNFPKMTFDEIVERAKKRGPLRSETERNKESVVEMIRRTRSERTDHIMQVLDDARRK